MSSTLIRGGERGELGHLSDCSLLLTIKDTAKRLKKQI